MKKIPDQKTGLQDKRSDISYAPRKRFSNIELLRVISMVMIVAHHYAVHTPWDSNLTDGKGYLIAILSSFGKVGVAIFFMITGYFLATRKNFSAKKVWHILLPTWFYSLTIFGFMLIFHAYGAELSWPLNSSDLQSFFPLLCGRYWFIVQYAVIFLLSPFLKKGLDALSDRELSKLGLLLFGIVTVVRFLRIFLGIGTGTIFTIPEGLYFVIFGYIVYRLRTFVSQKLALVAACGGTALLLVGPFLLRFLHYIHINAPSNFFWDSDALAPLLIAGSVIILFSRLQFSSRIVNYVASLSLGIYLIHDNIWMRQFLWGSNGVLHNLTYAEKPLLVLIIHSVISIIAVYVSCAFIEALRKVIVSCISRATSIVRRF